MTPLSPEERAEKIQLALIRMGINLGGALTATETLFAAQIREAVEEALAHHGNTPKASARSFRTDAEIVFTQLATQEGYADHNIETLEEAFRLTSEQAKTEAYDECARMAHDESVRLGVSADVELYEFDECVSLGRQAKRLEELSEKISSRAREIEGKEG